MKTANQPDYRADGMARRARMTEVSSELEQLEARATLSTGGIVTGADATRHGELMEEWSMLNRLDKPRGDRAINPAPRRTDPSSAGAIAFAHLADGGLHRDANGVLHANTHAHADRAAWVDTTTGQRLEVFAPGQRISERYRGRSGGFFSQADTQPLSLGGAIRGMVTGVWTGYEREKQAVAGTASGGGGHYLVNDELAATVIDRARAKSVILGRVPVVNLLADHTRIARIESDPTFAAVAENAAIPESDVVFGSVGLNPVKVACIVRCSRELAADAPNAPALIEQTLARALGAHLDRLAIQGNGGSDGITGLTVMDIPETGSVAGIAWEDLHNAAVAIRAENFNPDGYVVSPAIAGDLDIITSGDGTNSAKLWLGPPPSLTGVNRMDTTGCPDANIILGDFDEMIAGWREGIEISVAENATVNGQSTFDRHQIAFKVTTRIAFGVTHPKAFHRLAGITT